MNQTKESGVFLFTQPLFKNHPQTKGKPVGGQQTATSQRGRCGATDCVPYCTLSPPGSHRNCDQSSLGSDQYADTPTFFLMRIHTRRSSNNSRHTWVNMQPHVHTDSRCSERSLAAQWQIPISPVIWALNWNFYLTRRLSVVLLKHFVNRCLLHNSRQQHSLIQGIV